MRSNSASATDEHHHRLFIRKFLSDFRRQSSVNDYKFPNTLVCTMNLFFSRDFL
jgi:hypothetical protein